MSCKHTLAFIKQEESGWALVAAMLIMFLMTALGIWAMYTSSSETRISGNLNEEHLMFFFAEQGVDRVLSHLHYLEQGLFSQSEGLSYTYQGASNTLSPLKVLDNTRSLYVDSGGSVAEQQLFRISAYVDPKNYEYSYDRSVSRPVAISVEVENYISHYKKAFRAIAKPTSVWDLAYYSRNHNPSQRSDTGVCTGTSNSWYNCQTVFHTEDSVEGDIYIRNYNSSPDDGKLFVRGTPSFRGRVLWRNHEPYSLGAYSGGTYSNSNNQTKGGSSGVSHPQTMGMRNYAKDIEPYDISALTTSNLGWFKNAADLRLTYSSGNAYKVILRSDLDDQETPDGCQEEYRVNSAITFETNNGQSDCTGSQADAGAMLIYRVPWSDPPTTAQITAQSYGNVMKARHDVIVNDNGGIMWSPGGFGGAVVNNTNVAVHKRENNPSSPKFGAYDPDDIAGDYYFLEVPSQGTSNCSAGSCNGIVYVEGDLIISGVLDGRVTFVVAGDIYIDHEIEYEESPLRNIANFSTLSGSTVKDIDMLGLFATGDIVIPNSMPNKVAVYDDWGKPNTYNDDWSDAENGELGFRPTGRWTGQDEDTGNEDIHAVMMSWGYDCTVSGGSVSCNTSPVDATWQSDCRNFKIGLYAIPRTSTGLPSGEPYDAINNVWIAQGNDSGVLSIVGALIQNYPGRVGYDYDASGVGWANSSCTNGSGACNFVGHRLHLTRDPHLNYMTPAFPRGNSANRFLPYGKAAYDIISWEEIDPGAIGGSSDPSDPSQPY